MAQDHFINFTFRFALCDGWFYLSALLSQEFPGRSLSDVLSRSDLPVSMSVWDWLWAAQVPGLEFWTLMLAVGFPYVRE